MDITPLLDYSQYNSAWELLIKQGESKKYNRGENVFIDGHGLYCLKTGIVKIGVYYIDGTEKIISIYEAPNLLGEVSVIDGEPLYFYLEPLTKSELQYIPLDQAQKLIKSDINIAMLLLVSMSQKVRSVRMQAEDLVFTVPQRIAKMIIYHKRYGLLFSTKNDNTIAITHEQLASFIGTTRSQVTLWLNIFEKRGFIGKKRNTILIKDYNALKEIAHGNKHLDGISEQK